MKISKFIPAAVIAASVGLAPQANAFTGSYNVCDHLDSQPTVRGVELVMLDLIEAGYNSDTIAKVVVGSVKQNCPEYMPLLQQFVTKWG